jgi:ABC-type nickel/cobalt efflux system permease component RcnA
MIAALTGFIAGSVHVWSGPDHLTAIAPLAVRQQRGAWKHGARWGVGHTAGVTLVGVLSLLLRDLIPVEWLSSWGERLVGVMLLGIGLWALRKALQDKVHTHEHEHDGARHVHLHVHHHGHAHEQPAAHRRHMHAAFGIGTLHGLAGSSHFLGVLPILAFPTRLQAAAYLLAFGVGTIFSMAIFSWVLGAVSARWSGASVRIYRGLLGTCAVAALTVGVAWLAGWR